MREFTATMLHRRKRLQASLRFLVIFSPAIIAGLLVHQFTVNVPLGTDWEQAALFEKADAGELKLGDLTASRAGTLDRPLVPRLIVLAVDSAGGDLRQQVFVNFALSIASALVLFALIRRSLGDSRWTWGTALLVNLLIFCPLQYPGFLWASQTGFLLPQFCLVVSLWVLGSRWPCTLKFAGCLGLALLATYSSARGMVLWPVILFLGLFLPAFGTVKERRLFALLYGACAVAAIASYLYAAVDGAAPSEGGLGAEPGGAAHAVRFALICLGSPIARLFHSDPMQSALVCGILVSGAFLWGSLRQIPINTPREWDQTLPWIGAGIFAIASAIVFAIKRLADPLENALDPALLPATTYLYISLVGIGAHSLLRARRAASPPEIALRLSRLALVLAVAACALQFPHWVYGIHKMSAWRQARLEARFAIHFSEYNDARFSGRFGVPLEEARRAARSLNQGGRLEPPLNAEPGFGDFTPVDRHLGRRQARVKVAEIIGQGEVAVRGFATLPEGNRIADGVILTWRENRQSEWNFLAAFELDPVHTMRAAFIDGQYGAVANLSRRDRYAKWSGVASLTSLPEGGLEIRAWAADADKMTAHAIEPPMEIRPGRRGLGEILLTPMETK